ncbi:MAG: hypothetical protein HYZ34_09750 [Ignavibacteriae bacterium]|nr:hypothetical protein [Ignavibacteriota bacterium]
MGMTSAAGVRRKLLLASRERALGMTSVVSVRRKPLLGLTGVVVGAPEGIVGHEKCRRRTPEAVVGANKYGCWCAGSDGWTQPRHPAGEEMTNTDYFKSFTCPDLDANGNNFDSDLFSIIKFQKLIFHTRCSAWGKEENGSGFSRELFM